MVQSVAECRLRIWQIVHHVCSPIARLSISEASEFATPAMEAEDVFASTSLGPATAPNIRKLMETKPTTLALMHGSSFGGDTVGALGALADHYEARLQKAMGVVRHGV